MKRQGPALQNCASVMPTTAAINFLPQQGSLAGQRAHQNIQAMPQGLYSKVSHLYSKYVRQVKKIKIAEQCSLFKYLMNMNVCLYIC